MNGSGGPESGSMMIGPDKVIFHDDAVIIWAAREMSDWQVREFCRIPIYFQGRKYYLKRRSRMDPPYVMGYELEAWPAEYQGESTLSINYGEQYVAERDRGARTDQQNELLRLALLTIYPLLGFLWSRFKDRKLERFGFNPRSITEASLFVQLAFVICESVFLFVFRCGFIETAIGFADARLDLLLFVIGAADVVIRSNQVLRGDEHPDGLLEWLARMIVRLMARLKRKG